ncbi:MAG: DUF2911 domain-containing protein [Bacteroidetes bacterium]|nr:MAG: DUF2911 domain-containing protein [Bacteroidota bacterium]TAG90439.1 MAG: DUF2911 domain-containing protein [Bacteroidota bacterium]
MKLMKVLKITGIVILLLVMVGYGLVFYTKLASPKDVVELKEGDFFTKIVYCQPSVKNRKVFGEVVPFGKVWRTGANEATEITFNQDIVFGGKSVKAGTYALFTIPTPEKWTIILNSVLGQWGSFTYDSTKDVLRVEVSSLKNEKVVEKFKISLDKNEKMIDLTMVWEKTKVIIPIEKTIKVAF